MISLLSQQNLSSSKSTRRTEKITQTNGREDVQTPVRGRALANLNVFELTRRSVSVFVVARSAERARSVAPIKVFTRDFRHPTHVGVNRRRLLFLIPRPDRGWCDEVRIHTTDWTHSRLFVRGCGSLRPSLNSALTPASYAVQTKAVITRVEKSESTICETRLTQNHFKTHRTLQIGRGCVSFVLVVLGRSCLSRGFTAHHIGLARQITRLFFSNLRRDENNIFVSSFHQRIVEFITNGAK